MTCRTPRLRPMELQDLDAIMAIEETVFGDDAWPRSFFLRELTNQLSTYVVLELLFGDQAPASATLVGYAGYWMIEDEAHLMNIALAPAWQGRGLGEYLLLAALEGMRERGASLCTLEVRVSNARAQALYRKLGFQVEGRRRRYYQDNGEDALIMTTPPLASPSLGEVHRTQYEVLQARLEHTLCG